MSHRPRIVIVGGGFAGLAAARRLARTDADVLVIDRHNHHLFQPLLYQVATAALSPGDIASPIRWILRRQRNIRVLLATVTGVDRAASAVLLDDGARVPYDYLIVAAGVTHSYFGHDAWEQFAPGLKTLDDALILRRRMLLSFERAERESDAAERARLLTFVVIGGGPTGVELAGALAEIARHTLRSEFDAINPRSSRILLIEAGPTILSSFPSPLRDRARQALERLGVEVREQTRVTGVSDDAVQIGDTTLPAHTIMWAAGVAAAPLGAALGVPLDRAGRVVVERDLSVPGMANVFVVGDLAAFTDARGEQLPGVAQVAKQQGRHAADNLRRRLDGKPTTDFHYRDLGNMATVGRGHALADFGWAQFSGTIGWLLWLFVHVLFLIGFRNRLTVLLQWAISYTTYQRSVRLITGDKGQP